MLAEWSLRARVGGIDDARGNNSRNKILREVGEVGMQAQVRDWLWVGAERVCSW